MRLVGQAAQDSMGGVALEAGTVPALRELGLESALGVLLTDKDTQLSSGALLVGDAAARKWRPNDSFFLQAVGDQLVLAVSHTRLRSLVRRRPPGHTVPTPAGGVCRHSTARPPDC